MQFSLREWKMEDAQSVAQYANNAKIAGNLRDGFVHPYTIDDAKAFLRSCIETTEEHQCCRAIAINAEAAGSIALFLKEDVYCKTAEVGYWLAEPFWGRGIMSDALRQLASYAFETYDLLRIEAEPYARNAGSRRALEKAGFVLEGILKNRVWKNGVLQDSCIYAMLR